MRSRNTQGMPSFLQAPDNERESAGCENRTPPTAQGTLASRPFVERRRSAPIQAWPAALDSVQRHLLAFESANEQLLQSESRYRSMFEDAPIGMFQVTLEGEPLAVNTEMARILGYDSPDDCLAQIAKDPSLRFFDPSHWDDIDSNGGNGPQNGVDLQISCRDSAIRWIRFNLRPVREGDKVLWFDGTAEDVTSRKRVEIRTELLAYYDLLTGLPNRTLFHDRFNEVASELQESGGCAALMLVEFDGLKAINDCLGEHLGDRLLQEIADRIRAGAGEKGIVARVDGAEFGVILRENGGTSWIAAAEQIMSKLRTEYSLLGHTLDVFCSVGISVFPDNGEDYETLLKKADVAKTCSSEVGSNGFRIFTEEMNGEIQERMRLESGLRLALAKKELYLDYQPQVDLRTGVITGLEALLRWNSPQLGLVPPTRFIGVAESSSLIVPIGEWVLRSACAQARDWQDRGLPAVPVAVNVSPVQFRQQGFCELVRQVLRDTRLNPEFLELELTESLMQANSDVTASIIAELRALGVMVAIDDFGTGYSSLGYLKQFKVHRLKIARSFVQDLSDDPDDAAITIAIIKMAKAMNLAVLAEGVETKEQLLFMREQNCHTIQGFYFSKPLAVSEVDHHLKNGFKQLVSTAVN
jgi:diguanylate cyclase (GGDEF)-like protein/PAS domain S-box-containing protein